MRDTLKSFAIAGAVATAFTVVGIVTSSPAQAFTSSDVEICNALDNAPHTFEGFSTVVLKTSDDLDRGITYTLKRVMGAVEDVCPEHFGWIRSSLKEGTGTAYA